ncbi:hypothetical protein HMPREF0530_0541 [Lacticaseibacillus paracasei subsp. paracasei ATCC 25302 = DSM 5622 = JCM 8130]|nr:hypothetical protein HMPREF0530_0541 [Lacticaseibacillus paracasei subsp. paracasei ATCC 25302 = DSM 5622 = JCM 8130]
MQHVQTAVGIRLIKSSPCKLAKKPHKNTDKSVFLDSSALKVPA